MDLNFITVNPTMTLREVSELVRAHVAEQRQTPMVVVMDSKGKSQGFIPYKSLMLAPGTKTVDQVMHHLHIFPHHTDQEKVVRVAMREKGEVFGVVDENEQFIGVVHLRDLLKIAQMEATEDVLKFAGVSPEEELLGPASTAIRMRYKWLVINLATAFLASSVVHLFEGTIAQLAVLAAYMPIVAGMGGNAGTQTLAVAVRGLALGDVNARQRVHLITKEMMTGFSNGIVTGTIAAAIIYISGGNPAIGLILGISMMINMVVAGIAGAVIPLTLRALKIDPAVASAVFVTTATDVFGFFTFLGLATVFLL
jgi:magnesium transporter